MTTIVVIVLVVLLIGAMPVFPYNRGWGYVPGGLIAIILAVVAATLLL